MIKLITKNDFLFQIQHLIKISKKITVLTAYLSNRAVDTFLANNDCEITLFTSLYNEYVEYEALQLLLSRRAKVYIYSGSEFFHPKAFIFEGAQNHLIMGSSNFTIGGLTNNIELNLLSNDENVISETLGYIENLRNGSQFKLLTEEALQKYKKLDNDKKTHTKKHPTFKPSGNDLVQLHKQLAYPDIQISQNLNILKIRITEAQPSRDRYAVIWINKRKNIVEGNSEDFFPPRGTSFEVQCKLSGYELAVFDTKLTTSSSPQISGFYKKLSIYGIELHAGDILCFEELEKYKLYRFWLE